MNSLKAPDQLRQRIAWALSQVFAVSPSAINDNDEVEHWLVYYDIFVRNAFGSYRSMLKDVAYSPMMAEMLSFLGSKSTAYVWGLANTLQYADENFAREVMQLFSIGLYKVNDDGTQLLDSNKVPLNTYTNFDISEYARAWTGFTSQPRRGNVEELYSANRIDPLYIRIEWRDTLPKVSSTPFEEYCKHNGPLLLIPNATLMVDGVRPNIHW
jgi:uncharacterized protein (DUF1800 family)